MRWGMATLLATVWMALAGLAEARTPRSSRRFHEITARLSGLLDPPARRNLEAVVRYGPAGLGTGVLVKGVAGKDRTGLVLTTQHVLERHGTPPILFRGGQEGLILRTVASNQDLDYALLEVELPLEARARPARLRGTRLKARERVYAISAAANPALLSGPSQASTAIGAASRRQGEAVPMATIQNGRENGRGDRYSVRMPDRRIESYRFDLPNAPGASGSPVFSRRTHDVVALHWGGTEDPRRWISYGVPMRSILRDLARKLSEGVISADLAEPMTSWLGPVVTGGR
jgi:hypothetical protein